MRVVIKAFFSFLVGAKLKNLAIFHHCKKLSNAIL